MFRKPPNGQTGDRPKPKIIKNLMTRLTFRRMGHCRIRGTIIVRLAGPTGDREVVQDDVFIPGQTSTTCGKRAPTVSPPKSQKFATTHSQGGRPKIKISLITPPLSFTAGLTPKVPQTVVGPSVTLTIKPLSPRTLRRRTTSILETSKPLIKTVKISSQTRPPRPWTSFRRRNVR